MLLGRLKRGELRVCEICKTKKNRRYGLLNYTQVYTRVEGGIGGPNPPNGALGSPVKTSQNLFRKIKLQSSCMFFTVTFAWFCTGRRTQAVLEAGLKFNDSIKARYDDFSPVSEAAQTLCGL